MADMEGTVTRGYNSGEIAAAQQKISDSYTDLLAKSNEWIEEVKAAINACWFGPDSEKFVQKMEEKIQEQNDALKQFFEAVNQDLTTVDNSWKDFQASATFE